MKKVPCSNPDCNKRRIHHERPDETRETVLCDVPDDHAGKVFCSITCACMAGYYHVRDGWIKDPQTDEPVRTTLSAENAKRFLEIIEQEDLSEETKHLLKRGMEESAAGQTTVLNLDDLDSED